VSTDWYNAVIEHRVPLQPIETGQSAKLEKLIGIKAVIFDVYGTLVISGSGDVGSADETDRGEPLSAALAAVGIAAADASDVSIDVLHEEIRRANQQRQSAACPKPEVDIVDVWRRTLSRCGIASVTTAQVNRLAAEYEARANPTWPMPGASELLRTLRARGLKLGIVSNAQQFTIPLVEELGGTFGVDSVFDRNLCVFSCRYRHAKPSPRLFDVLCQGLHQIGIAPSQAVYVGNDRLNDVWSAARAGLRTAWFVGDRRSLRAREDDPRVADLPHDLVLAHLDQLVDCL
jgi:putative hydrolase of the HAD superfamily